MTLKDTHGNRLQLNHPELNVESSNAYCWAAPQYLTFVMLHLSLE